MTARKTISARVADAMAFKNAVASSNNTFYVTTSRASAWADSVPDLALSVEEEYLDYWESLVNGERVLAADVKMGALVEEWVDGRIWKHYDHRRGAKENYGGADASVGGDTVWTLENSKYSVFRCLDNNKGGVSTEEPLGTQTGAADASYILADGYQWKFLYGMAEADFDKFKVGDNVPVTEDSNVADAAVDGAIDSIVVEKTGSVYGAVAVGTVTNSANAASTKEHRIVSTGGDAAKIGLESTAEVEDFAGRTVKFQYDDSGYVDITATEMVGDSNVTKTVSGIVVDKDSGNNTITVGSLNGVFSLSSDGLYDHDDDANTAGKDVRVVVTGSNTMADVASYSVVESTLSAVRNFYRGSMFWVVGGSGSDQANNFSEIQSYTVNQEDGTRTVVLVDTIENVNDTSRFVIAPRVEIKGDGEDAAALAVVDAGLHSLKSICVVHRGRGYTHAEIDLVANVTGDIGSAVAMISPPGGHGSNVYGELSSTNVLVAKLLNNQTEKIEAGNFHQIGLLRNPRFANVAVNVSSVVVGTGTGMYSPMDFTDEAPVYKFDAAPATIDLGSLGGATVSTIDDTTDLTFASEVSVRDEDVLLIVEGEETQKVSVDGNFEGTTVNVDSFRSGFAYTSNAKVYFDASNGDRVGIVVGSDANNIYLTDSNGLIGVGDYLMGDTGTIPVTATVDSVSTNKARTDSSVSFFDQRTILDMLQGTSTTSADTWADGDVVYQSEGYETVEVGDVEIANVSKAVLHSINRAADNEPRTIALTATRGPWRAGATAGLGNPIKNAENGTDEEYEFLEKTNPDLVHLSGNAVHLENIGTVGRKAGTKEKVKMVLRY